MCLKSINYLKSLNKLFILLKYSNKNQLKNYFFYYKLDVFKLELLEIKTNSMSPPVTPTGEHKELHTW